MHGENYCYSCRRLGDTDEGNHPKKPSIGESDRGRGGEHKESDTDGHGACRYERPEAGRVAGLAQRNHEDREREGGSDGLEQNPARERPVGLVTGEKNYGSDGDTDPEFEL